MAWSHIRKFPGINVQISITPDYSWSSDFLEEQGILKFTNNELMVKNPFVLKVKIVNQEESVEIEKIVILLDSDTSIVKFMSSVEGHVVQEDKLVYEFSQTPLRADYFRDQISLHPIREGKFYASFHVKIFPRGKEPVSGLLNVVLEGTIRKKIVDFKADLMPQTTFLNNEIIYTFRITNFSATKTLRNISIQNVIDKNYLSEDILEIKNNYMCQLSYTDIYLEDIAPTDNGLAVLTLKPKKPAFLNLQPHLNAALNGGEIKKPHKPFLLIIEDTTADKNLLTKLYNMDVNTPFLSIKSGLQFDTLKALQSPSIDEFYVDPYEQVTFLYKITREIDKDRNKITKIILDFFIRNNSFQSALIQTVNLGIPAKPISVRFNSHEENNPDKLSPTININKVLEPSDSMQLQVEVPPPQTQYFLAPTLTFSFIEPKKLKVGADPQLIGREVA